MGFALCQPSIPCRLQASVSALQGEAGAQGWRLEGERGGVSVHQSWRAWAMLKRNRSHGAHDSSGLGSAVLQRLHQLQQLKNFMLQLCQVHSWCSNWCATMMQIRCSSVAVTVGLQMRSKPCCSRDMFLNRRRSFRGRRG